MVFPEYELEATWVQYEVNGQKHSDPNGEAVYKWNNGSKKIYVNFDHGTQLPNGIIVVYISKEDFKLDIPYLTEWLIKPKVYPDVSECYKLKFDGKIKGKKPVEGILYIGKVFEFTGKWRDGLVYGQGIIHDTENKKQIEVNHVNGVTMESKEKPQPEAQPQPEPEVKQESKK